ncbi:uncharacterized protein LOC124311359 isoform X1 [Daphnia pulicaria]|uniref:uncharacterized protein LOC124311359 isoform X1 n=1 Tax=Daphnia pulicaria TaxID=35523 RepID=UPI001EEA49CB|nr:uncharacterized protein LOC124311359 isoform X1 [Daphnia pulicaria]
MVNYNVLLLSDVVLLMAGSTNSVPMTFGHGYQTAMPTPYYYTTTYASAGYYTIKAPVNYTTPYDAPSYYTDALNYRYPSVAASINFGFVLLLNVVSFLADHWSLGMVDTKPQRCRLTTQQHTYLPVTTPGLPLTTLKMLNITQGRMLPQFTTPRNLSITLLRATTEAPVYYTTNASECYMIIYAALNYYTGTSKCNTINVKPICKQGDVSWVWRILNHNVTVLLRKNLLKDLLLHRDFPILHRKGSCLLRDHRSRVLRCPQPLH